VIKSKVGEGGGRFLRRRGKGARLENGQIGHVLAKNSLPTKQPLIGKRNRNKKHWDLYEGAETISRVERGGGENDTVVGNKR